MPPVSNSQKNKNKNKNRNIYPAFAFTIFLWRGLLRRRNDFNESYTDSLIYVNNCKLTPKETVGLTAFNEMGQDQQNAFSVKIVNIP